MSVTPEIAVVGSLNLDVSVPVPHLPVPGETVLGGDALWSPGGKGGNQAVAAARLGRRVAMVGCVGDDAAGTQLLAALESDGVDFAGQVLADVPTGLAAIGVADDGENSIIVSPGANARLTAEFVHASTAVAEAAVVLAQLEMSAEAVAAAGAVARRLVLNPAPAPATEAGRAALADLAATASIVVPNRVELAALVGGTETDDRDELVDQARSLGVSGVVVTLGGDGALVVERQADGTCEVTPVAPVSVKVVDTTAAGDAFCGGLADALVDGAAIVDAARWAARVAAVAVTRRGAQASLGRRADVDALP